MRVAVLTISDRAAIGEREDRSGPILVEMVQNQGWEIVSTHILPDDQQMIEEVLQKWADSGEMDLILTTGGTGFSPRDRTPEATRNVIDRLAPGIVEAIRMMSMKITPHAMLSRAVAGIRSSTLIVNLAGSPKAAKENLEIILPALPHAIQLLKEDPQAESGHRIPPRSYRT
jgi:molybdopterin adenylyltransferase